MSDVMMECGHAANSTLVKTGEPSCVICIGVHPGATVVAKELPDLNGREAQCAYCGKKTPSGPTLAFFGHRPDKQYDSFYDGCRGWD